MEEYDWVLNGERDPGCETNGCFSVITQEVVSYGVKGYYKCDQMECMRNKTWHKTGKRLPGCPVGSMFCWDWTKTEVVPVGSVMNYKQYAYKCTENDWEQTGPNGSPSDNGCWSPTIHQVIPYGIKSYYRCDQVECKPDNTWKPTGERLPNCPAGSVACYNWMTNETVPVDSTMYFECNQYLCMEEYDWVLNGERDPGCETNGCFSVITQEVVSYGVKGYYKCDQMECMRNKTWHKT